MPIYPYRCPTCGRDQDAFNRIDERDTSAPECCGKQTERQLSAPMVSVPGDCHYECPVTGEQVTSYRQRANIMARENLRDGNDMTPEFVVKRQKERTRQRQELAAQLPDLPSGISQEEIFAA